MVMVFRSQIKLFCVCIVSQVGQYTCIFQKDLCFVILFFSIMHLLKYLSFTVEGSCPCIMMVSSLETQKLKG